jgi:hypothetical protein
MVKNIKRYQKAAKREGGQPAADDMDIIPATFVLPQVLQPGMCSVERD